MSYSRLYQNLKVFILPISKSEKDQIEAAVELGVNRSTYLLAYFAPFVALLLIGLPMIDTKNIGFLAIMLMALSVHIASAILASLIVYAMGRD